MKKYKNKYKNPVKYFSKIYLNVYNMKTLNDNWRTLNGNENQKDFSKKSVFLNSLPGE